MHYKNALLCGAALTCFAVAPALAQDAPAPVTSRTTIETVIVTAERREQKSQDVAVPLSAISGESMDSLGIRDVASLGQRVPSLHFGPGPTGGENFITMRGLTSANTTNGGDTPVSFSIDGVYFGRSTGVDPEMFDIQTIEVLRGPQGTLYGRNSVGGSINIVTNKPTDELAGHVDALIGDYNARIFRGWANVPLYDCGDCKILARIIGVSANHDGYQKNLSQKPNATYDSDGQDYDMLRAHLLFQFNADIDLLLSASTSHGYTPGATKTQWNQYNSAQAGYRFGGQTWYNDPRVVEKDYPERGKQVRDSLSATFGWNLGFAKLTSILARQKVYMFQSNDADSSNLDIGHSEAWQVSTSQYSNETRLASNNDADPLKWIIGGFYFHEHTEMQFPYSDTGVNATPSAINSAAFNLSSANTYKTTSWAVFGQVDYDLGKTSADFPLTATVGLRYSHDHKYGFGGIRYYLPGISAGVCPFVTNYYVPGLGCRVAATNVAHDSRYAQITGKGGLSYKVTPDVMVYGNVSHGYISGGILGRVYKPETAWNYEVGFKSQFLDNTIQLNANAYWLDVTNIQVFVQDAALGSRVDNAAGATIKGLEAEFIAIPVEGLRLNVDVAVTDAKFKDYITDDGRFPGIALVNNKGNRLIQTPKWTINTGLEYAIDTEAGTFTPRVDAYFSSDIYYTSFNSPLARQKSYSLIDFAVKWQDTQRKYQIDVFVRNAFDKDVISSDGTQSGSFGVKPAGIASGYGLQVDNFSYKAPRTIGARFGVNF